MQLSEVLSRRRSVREFSDRRVNDNIIKKIIHAGTLAPSYCNSRDWRFVFIIDKEQFVRMGGADIIANSPIAILITYRKSVNDYRDDIQSASACIQNMLLKATELGIGSCWVCHLPLKFWIRKRFHIPHHYEIIACVVFGYPKEPMKVKEREFDYEKLFVFNKGKFNLFKYLYIRQLFRPRWIEKKFTKRFK